MNSKNLFLGLVIIFSIYSCSMFKDNSDTAVTVEWVDASVHEVIKTTSESIKGHAVGDIVNIHTCSGGQFNIDSETHCNLYGKARILAINPMEDEDVQVAYKLSSDSSVVITKTTAPPLKNLKGKSFIIYRAPSSYLATNRQSNGMDILHNGRYVKTKATLFEIR